MVLLIYFIFLFSFFLFMSTMNIYYFCNQKKRCISNFLINEILLKWNKALHCKKYIKPIKKILNGLSYTL